MSSCRIAVLLALAAAPGQAAAHLVSVRFGELYSGILHPLTTLQHLVPWLALGLLGGLQSPRTARWALGVFPLAVLLGTAMAQWLPGLPAVAWLNAASFVVLGLLVALAVKVPVPAFVVLVAMFGLSHGYANAAPEIRDYAYLLYALGVALTAYAMLALVAASTQALASGPPWGAIAVRAAGSWIAAAGVMYVGFMLFAV